nr:hydrogenase expression/formation C-terminal domain-containing protein [Ideonella sp. B508-1]
MNPSSTRAPFPIPVVAAGPGSQIEEETLDYISMPQGMATYQSPILPEPEEMRGRDGALRVLRDTEAALQAAVAGQAAAPVSLAGLSEAELALVNQVLGEGEVAARVLPAPGLGEARIQESVFAGVWRVVQTEADGTVQDTIEVGDAPALLRAAARADALGSRPDLLSAPAGVMNAQPILAELEDQRQRFGLHAEAERAQLPAHVVNLSLLPLSPRGHRLPGPCAGHRPGAHPLARLRQLPHHQLPGAAHLAGRVLHLAGHGDP